MGGFNFFVPQDLKLLWKYPMNSFQHKICISKPDSSLFLVTNELESKTTTITITGTLQLSGSEGDPSWEVNSKEKKKGQSSSYHSKTTHLKSQKRFIHSSYPTQKPKTGLTQYSETRQAVSNNPQ